MFPRPEALQFLQSRITSVRSKIHHILSNDNADRNDLFSAQGDSAYFNVREPATQNLHRPA